MPIVMRFLSIVFLFTTLFTSCDSFKTFEEKDIIGSWEGEKWGFTFNEDHTCSISQSGRIWYDNANWRQMMFGNTLEFVANGKVILTNVTVKSVDQSTLTLELRPLIGSQTTTTETHKLSKVE